MTACLFGLVLAGCGGSDTEAPVTLALAADASTLAWRSSSTVDVLANDRASSGGLELAAVGTPAHGSAAIVGGRLQYTPTADFFGVDRVSYTARATQGGATAQAEVVFTVQARLNVAGTVTDAPVPNAAVTLQWGGRTLATTANAAGQYEAELVSSDPSEMVRVEGRSVDGRVRLASLVGSFAALTAAAPSDGSALGATRLGTLDATHWSTARLALLQAALGRIPTNDDEADTALPADDLVNVATAIRLVSDRGYALPEGVADTLALANNMDAVETVAAAAGASYAAEREAVVADAPQLAGDGPVSGSERTLALFQMNNSYRALHLLRLRPDGTALVGTGGTQRDARWRWAERTLEVDYTTPIVTESFASYTPPPGGNGSPSGQYRAEFRELGLRVQLAVGRWDSGSTRLRTVTDAAYTEGPLTGQPPQTWTSSTSVGSVLFPVIDLARRPALLAAELAVGTRLAGVPTLSLAQTRAGQGFVQRDDILLITGENTARFELDQADASWTLQDGWLQVQRAGLPTLRMTRLARDARTGLQAWVATEGEGLAALPLFVQAASAGLLFDAQTAARDWILEGARRVFLQNTVVQATLQPDGSNTGNLWRGSWRLTAQGQIELSRVVEGQTHLRLWTPLLKTGRHWLVFEDADFGLGLPPGAEREAQRARRLNWLYDDGPA